MTTATRNRLNGEKSPEIGTEVFRDLAQRWQRLGPEDRQAVAELVQLLVTTSGEDQAEAQKALHEILFPEIAFVGLDVDDTVDPGTKERVDQYREMVGKGILRRRQALKMTQVDLAKRAGIPQSHVSRLERGKHVPTYLTMERLAKALDTMPSQLDPGFEENSSKK